MKRGILLFLLSVAFSLCASAGKVSTITATIHGYNGETVYFDLIEQMEDSFEFPYAEGQTYSFDVELKDITMLKINNWVWICLKPGDSITVDLTYDGRNYKSAEFSGAEDVVAVNTALRDMRMARVAQKYRMDPDAALVTLVPAADYHAQCLERWQAEKAALDAVRKYMPDKMYYYLLSEHEAIFLGNLIVYPAMRASYDGKPVEQVMPADYWTVMDNYEPRGDEGSLYSHGYDGFLLTFADYAYKRNLVRAGKDWRQELSLRGGFDMLVDFYGNNKNMVDAALCVYLYNAAAAGRDFDDVDKLVKLYLKKYNKNKKYREILQEVMQ